MKRIVAILAGLILSAAALADDAGYAGIWQDKSQNGDYYVIQENGSDIVLIALPGIEATGDTLRFSYIGSKQDLQVTRLSAEPANDILQRLQLQFDSATEGKIIPICEVCTVITIQIEKIF